MAEYRESFGEDVGGKLLLFASILIVFGILALILLPIGSAFAPAPPPPEAGAAAAPAGGGIVGALLPGIGMIVVGLIFGALGGLLLGYAKAHHEEPPPSPR